jgi:hypothetical protein
MGAAIRFRGQAALEYMVMLGFAIAIILPLWLYVNSALTETRSELDVTYAKVAVTKLKDAANSVYVQGPPASVYMDVEMPSNIQSISISGREIVFNLDTPGGISEVYDITLPNLQGAIAPRMGRIYVLVKAENTSLVSING